MQRLSYDSREAAFARCDDILAEFSTWPFGQTTSSVAGPVSIGGGTRKREGGSGGAGRESVQELVREVRKEMTSGTTSTAGAGGGVEEQEELCFEVVATVLEIFGRMDSLVSVARDTIRLIDSASTPPAHDPGRSRVAVAQILGRFVPLPPLLCVLPHCSQLFSEACVHMPAKSRCLFSCCGSTGDPYPF